MFALICKIEFLFKQSLLILRIEFILKKILLVGSYTPRKCGIATHLQQLEDTLRANGDEVDILSSPECQGTFRENLRGGFNILKLIRYSRKYDLINIHFEFSEFFHLGHSPIRILNIFPLIALGILFRVTKNLNLIMHELPPTPFSFQRTFLQRMIWGMVPKITFFTFKEKHSFEQKFDLQFQPGQCQIEDVTRYYKKNSNLNRNQARNKFNINSNSIIFLCIGFINESKGYDRIASIISNCHYSNCELYIVGSVRLEHDVKAMSYALKLKSISEDCSSVHFVNYYLSDQDFDEWIIASDYVVVPYWSISNSGVLGRAKIFGKPAIVSNVGGLCEQIGDNDFLFSSNEDLDCIIKNISMLNNSDDLTSTLN